MTPDEYVKDRLDHQINWLESKSAYNQRCYSRLSLLQLAAASTIPILAGVTESNFWARMAIGVLGALIAVLAGVLSLQRFQAKWIEYRSTCELLKREKFMYLTGVEPYAGADGFAQLVTRVESALAKENSSWAQTMLTPAATSKLAG